MLVPSTSMQEIAGLGATPRKTRTITLDPLLIEGRVPAPDKKFQIPWKWIAIAGGVGALYLWARHAKKKGARRAAIA